MAKYYYLLIATILVVGCTPAKPKVIDPCKQAPSVCWGRAGVMASDVSACAKLATCNDWEMRAR